jgi:hypothetical protein
MLDGVVYKLKCKDENIKEFYVGSSVNFNQRKISHKTRCNSPKAIGYNLKVYRFIREYGCWDNWCFEILLEVQVESKEELRLNYEAKYQLDLKPSLNSKVEGRTDKQYREDHKEERLEYAKQYYEDHKEEILEKQKEYYEDNKEEILEKQKQYREDHKEEQKQYYEDHKEELLEKQKQYREDHKEEILEKFECECGGKYTRKNKAKHERTKKHQKNLFY